MNMLSQNIVAFVPRHTHMAVSARIVARDTTLKSANLICRWDLSPITGRLNCVWTSSDDAGDTEAPIDLRLAS